MKQRASVEQQPSNLVGYVYLVTNLINGKEYVGQTRTSVEHRWAQHRLRSKCGRSALHAAMRRYGVENFRIDVLARVYGCRDDLLKAEAHQVRERQSLAPIGYNLMPGGEGVDFSNVQIKAVHLEAVRAMAASTHWRAAQHEGAQKRLSDPQWRSKNREALARARSVPECRQKIAEHWRRYRVDPEMQSKHLEGIRQRSDSEWKVNHRLAMERLHTDPRYVAKRDDALRRAAEGRTKKAVERDLMCSPEEAARRVRRRESSRRRAAKKRLTAQETRELGT